MPMDYGHAETDRQLKSLEKKLKKMYRQAARNAEQKFTQYMDDFYRKDTANKAKVKAGTWSKEEYENWRANQLAYSKHLEEIKDIIAKDLHNVNKIAMKMARNGQLDVYALNYNFGTYEIEHGLGIDTSFDLYDRDTVERLMEENPDLLPPPSKKRQEEIDKSDVKWNKDKLTSTFTSSIVSGDDIPTMARRIAVVAQMDRNAAIRNARTMYTGAENGGRVASYKRAEVMGIDLKEQWVATLDDRTRHSHRQLDGELVKVGETFSNGCKFPGDPNGPPWEVWNCRCTLVTIVNGIDPMAFDKTDTLRRKLQNEQITYEQWKADKPKRKKKG